MLTPNEVSKLKEELLSAQKPLFYYHDDPDGLASFLLCYRYIKEGKGLPVKAYPRITIEYARHVQEYGADKVFVLDVAMVDQEFIDAVKVPVIWVDHHTVLQRDRVTYMNPQTRGVNIPTPVLIWQVTGEERPQDLWIATTGSIGDWYYPPFAETLKEAYPALLPASTVEDAMYGTDLGILVKVFSFSIKGKMGDVLTCVKILTRIDDPYEILHQTSPRGKKVWQHHLDIDKHYVSLKEDALKHETTDRIYVYIYHDDKLSLTKDLANELLARYKDKVIILGREKSGEYRCSLRAPKGIKLSAALEKALVGLQGYGGGHEQACGAAIKKEEWKEFLERLRKELQL